MAESVLPSKSSLYVLVGDLNLVYWSVPVSSLVQQQHADKSFDPHSFEIPHIGAVSAKTPLGLYDTDTDTDTDNGEDAETSEEAETSKDSVARHGASHLGYPIRPVARHGASHLRYPIRPVALGGSDIMPLDLGGCSWMSFVSWNRWLYCMGELSSPGSQGGCSNHVMRFKVEPPVLLGPTQRRSMNSVKGVSIAVEKNDFIYNLSFIFGIFGIEHPEHTFEALDAKNDVWYALEKPPFHVPSKYFVRNQPLSYVVMEKKICVSTSKAAFAYDIYAHRWEQCNLFGSFDSFPPKQPPSLVSSTFYSQPTYIGYGPPPLKVVREGFPAFPYNVHGLPAFPYNVHLNRWNQCDLFGNSQEGIKGGPPFPFSRGGLLYGKDCLICLERSVVVAYSIAFGRVVKSYDLFPLPGIINENNDIGPVVDLGNGYFCVTYNMFTKEGFIRLVVFTFKVWKLTASSKDRLLEFEVCSSYAFQVDGADDLIPQFSFAV